jgi:biopolymer transport protein ExbD
MLPDRGLVGGAMLLLLLVPMFLIISPIESRGIYVRLTPQLKGVFEHCLGGPIIVTVRRDNASNQMLLNGKRVVQQDLARNLQAELATRANWEVYVEGADPIDLGDAV